MININITPQGEVNISQEPIAERQEMHKTYNATGEFSEAPAHEAGVGETSDQTAQDGRDETFFRKGWEACSAETKLWYVRGEIEEFFNLNQADALEAGMASGREIFTTSEEDAREDELEGGYPPVPPIIADDPAIKVVTDSGEPDLEREVVKVDDWLTGTWTMSKEEYQSRMEETYARGVREGEAKWTVTTERSLRMMASELDLQLFPDGTKDLTRGDVLGWFAINLAKRLGWTVDA